MIKAWVKAIWHNMRCNTEESSSYFSILGLVLIISYIGFYFFNITVSSPTGYENFTLRLVISACGLALMLNQYWPKLLLFMYIKQLRTSVIRLLKKNEV